ncbi:Arc family DNA-binding protein [Roseomonas frigidaquae]|uniref:Arc family DNA-binding protein n=1 Tax=Falsiroseomonas frigidaquae TaxID=487318 RepID=A0ABX1F431_9PROT|nr:Arc family DNA-binding protein [Falsiroseomonas frigidaquae]NKE47029.1 Arc family DNA-binding protein [Falsiroseomonas frigidaquae]
MARDDPEIRFRAPPALKEELEAAAKANGRSLNAEVVGRLQMSFSATRRERLQAQLQAQMERAQLQAEAERALLQAQIEAEAGGRVSPSSVLPAFTAVDGRRLTASMNLIAKQLDELKELLKSRPSRDDLND